ncbi:PREDICTED: peptidyl-tRNA hydrolase 2, mitochondrial isoform X1 [Wasmannia auropunctata]|uniref:peptidyl-tRNA hydrolase 2, mitochondrial isoform X1 n=1 Tax=Wasmannia auropunctata TaxID=64793 RepID=UPI0005EF1EC4|nr:PREDICTED: peptidyl-tRNA hydrolase 2, mitochondrial isoform X1 [Wasmannia auropunctata]XP_011693769.1 PREDICTED: peptidyl-tRNA hydrolase 2, mitochondrial isoform X1 [Wasmannia auropunctata]XP_011693770.1 PREDICTED: peptidyl-tRNA hydrolase 2, mitochondrial isoform X1 [Wasmannia auropunctata]XP_011693771.1 PREDICTED: peptidyl-tRNA hydrolase 2, mitochondrial isoform X1 [Wasmannia auropunctata]
MDAIIDTIVAQATDPKVAYMAAVLFGYCLYKLITMTMNRKNPRSRAEVDSDETDDDDVTCTDKYDEDRYKLILVIRTDLKMGKGKVAAQCSHAAVAAYKAARKYPKILRAWEESGQAKITLKVDSEAALTEIAKEAKAAGLLSNVVHDAGHTQIPAGSKTVCAVGPGPEELIDQVTGHLKLF